MAGVNSIWPFLLVGIIGAGLSGIFFAIFMHQLAKKGSLKIMELMREKVGSDQVLNSIDSHFADFVQNRLGKEMPVLNMFIDDRLVEELRLVFINEVRDQLPGLATQWLGDPQKIGSTISSNIWNKSRIYLFLFLFIQCLAITMIGYLII